MELWNASPESLLEAMSGAGLARAYLVPRDGGPGLRASHPLLDGVARVVESDARDYHGHGGLFLEVGAESGHLLSACVHRTRRGQAAGGVRFWTYATLEDFVRDGLRLSRGMGHKNALAGLWWGGGKGVIARRPGTDHRDPELRAAIYRDYGRFISGLRGCYVTAEDAGTTAADMVWIHRHTRFTTCIPPALGGSGNPSELTARGVVAAMEAALERLDLGGLAGRTVAMQGVGNVGRFMIRDLLERGVTRIVGADVDEHALAEAREGFPDAPLELRLVPPGDDGILAEPCDVLAPNATGATLNAATIPGIAARIVCGCANNQLADAGRDAPALAARGILYVPDFLANRMGIVNCSNEQYGNPRPDPAIERHLDREAPEGIHQRCLAVFRRAQETGRTPAEEAQALADELSEELHPLWGDRAGRIIATLVAEGWDRGRPRDPEST